MGHIIPPAQMGLLIVLATCTGYRASQLWLHPPSHPGSIPKSQAAQSVDTTCGPQLLSHWLLVLTIFLNPGSPKTVFPNCLSTWEWSHTQVHTTARGGDLGHPSPPDIFSLEHTDEIEPKYMPRSPGSKALLWSLHMKPPLASTEGGPGCSSLGGAQGNVETVYLTVPPLPPPLSRKMRA